MNQVLARFASKNMISLITVLFVLVNGMLFLKLGVSVDDDTYRYLGYAEEIREQGMFFKPHEFWYIGYVLFVLLVTSIHHSLGAIVIAQVLLSYLAVLSLHASAKRIYGSEWAGLWAVGLFLSFFMISFWNFWIYAESLLISLTCLSFFFIVKWIYGDTRFLNLTVGVFVVIFAFFTKPTGVAILAAVGTILLLRSWQTATSPWWKGAFIFICAMGFLMLLNQMLSTFGFIRDYQTGEVVFNIQSMVHKDYTKWLIINPPDNLYIPSDNYSPLVRFSLLVFGNPIYSIKLFFTKLFFYLMYIRPYFSPLHNILALLVLIPVYVAFIREIGSRYLFPELRIVILVFAGISVLSSVLLTVDWNSRFLVAVLPVIFLLSSNQLAIWFCTPKFQ